MSDATVADDAASEEPAAPADELREGQLAQFTEALGDQVLGSHIAPGRELWVRVDRSAWVAAAELAKSKLGCTFFDFLSAIDWMPSPWGRYEDALLDKLGGPDSNGDANDTPVTATTGQGIPYVDPASIKQGVAGGDTRLQVMCRVSDVRRHHGVVLKVDLPDDDPTLASLTGVWAGANWHERECWEMFGVTFEGHPGLRHLYLPGAFEGNPLRKDFPLLARLVKPWPGIVDVEPMPGGDEPAEGEDATATASPEGESAAATPETPAAADAETTAPGDATSEVEAEAAEGHAESDADPEAVAVVDSDVDTTEPATVVEGEVITDSPAASDDDGADDSDDQGEAVAAAPPTAPADETAASDTKADDETDTEAGGS